MPAAKMYSVYRTKTDTPLVVYGTSKECAKAMGIKLNSFFHYIARVRKNPQTQSKWTVYEDSQEE